MNNETRKKAILKIVRDSMTKSDICDCQKPEKLKKLPMGRLVYDFRAETKLRKALQSLLQNEQEGKGV